MRLTRLTLTSITLALAATCANAETSHQYDIPAQPLSSALETFNKLSGIPMFYTEAVTAGKRSTALNGSYSTSAALARLLTGTGLSQTVTPEGTVSLERQPTLIKTTNSVDSSEGQMMPRVTVEADAEYDAEYYADPYNKDYVIPNATAGTKTDTPIMETPLNVQVISKQVLKDRQVFRLADSLKNVSGVTTTTSSGSGGVFGGTQQAIFLRGFSSETFFRNGFRLQQGSTSRELANVEAVEVLKGPAAILYGLVEPGGMVNIVTKQPLATPYYGFTQQFGSYDLYRTTFDASGPLTKNKDVLYRANLSYENSGSFRDFVGREDVFFAPVLKWNISPQTQITFEMEYNHLHQGLDNGSVPIIPGLNLNVPINRNYGGYSPSTTETIFGGFNWSHQFDDDWSLKHRFSVNAQSFKTPFSTFSGIAGDKQFIQKQLGATDENPIVDPILNNLPNDLYFTRARIGGDIQNNTTSTNLDLVGHFDTFGLKHTLLLGGDYYRLDSTTKENDILSGAPLSYVSIKNPVEPGTLFGSLAPYTTVTSLTDQYGLYIQDQIKLPYDVHVTGGIRYQYIHQSRTVQDTEAFGGFSSQEASTQDAVTPRVGILWHPKSWLSLYANYAESFGPNTGSAFVSKGISKSIAPTSAAQYEGGMKFSFFDGKLRTNLAYFDLTKTNITVGDPFHKGACGGQDCSIALGEVRSRGPELDIQGEILPGWNVIATWTNTDIRVTKTSPGDNTAPVTSGNGSYTLGSRLTNVPRNTGSLWSTYEVQGGDFKGLALGGGVTLRDGAIVGDAGGAESSKLPGYATFDLMAGYNRQIGDAKVSVQFNINNLLDKQYFSSATTYKAVQSSYVDYGTPRTFMGQVSIQY